MGHWGRRHRDSFIFEVKRQSTAQTLQSAPLTIAGAKRNFCVNTTRRQEWWIGTLLVAAISETEKSFWHREEGLKDKHGTWRL